MQTAEAAAAELAAIKNELARTKMALRSSQTTVELTLQGDAWSAALGGGGLALVAVDAAAASTPA